MLWVHKRNISEADPKLMFDRKLLIQNKTSSLEDFEFIMRFNCIYLFLIIAIKLSL